MGEETVEEKKEETKEEEKKEPEPVPEEIVLNVYMHCEACARKVGRSLRKFEGVEDVITDYKAHKVVVKGKTADPIKVCERIQKKSGRKVEIISPLPKPPEEPKEEEKPPETKPDEPPPVITVVLLVHMHCGACAQVLQKRIRKLEETDVGNNQVIVKGVFDPTALCESVYRKTGKQAYIVPPPPAPEEEKKEEEKKEEEKKEEEKVESKTDDIKKLEYWHLPRSYVEYAYPPQIFSDENPNACTVM
ncbi:hypothetical protein ACHQM5_014659 [Ranunculus cassubicifolius]